MSKRAEKDKRTSHHSRGRLIGPGLSNICLCYILILSALLSPIALLFAFLFAEPDETRVYAHYFYIRTTVALLVIGVCIGCLMIVLGASISSSVILAGLVLLALTLGLTVIRCIRGFFSAMRGKAPQNYKSYFV
ncbi:hypothetical protein ABLO27_08160 [Roseibium sp. SCPC15]|jgi:uncharacterized membrane protein|uniref:hypothetical protein n=1 Tax=Roseibium sp. SCP15 TaxID=3141376 RepID=UPI00333A905F